MKKIPLTNSDLFVIINNEDYNRVNQYKWFLKKAKDGKLYAARSVRIGKKVKTVWLHRFVINAEKYKEVHHENHNKLDCRRKNLIQLSTIEHSKESAEYYNNIKDEIPF